MRIFDLVFLSLAVTSIVAIVLVIVAALQGNPARARTIGLRLGAAIVVYMIVVATVGLVSPQRSIALGVDQCADDWCIAADSSHRDANGPQATYTVNFRLSSRARRVSQRERFVVAYLRDADGRRFEAQPDPSSVPFDTLLQAGEAVRATRRFVVPTRAKKVGLVIAREPGVNFPGCCIIGDDGSLLHKRTIVQLDAGR
jgi:hypothetical protein